MRTARSEMEASSGAAQSGSSLARRTLAGVARNGYVRKLAVSIPFVREVAWRFVAGEDLQAGLDVIRALNAKGIKGTLNHVGTHVRSETEAILAADEAIAALRGLNAAALDSHISVKLTQIGLDIRPDVCRTQLRRVLDCAREVDTFVRIDMEESGYVESTIGLFEEMREEYGAEKVGIVLQSYLRDRPDDLAPLAAAGPPHPLRRGPGAEAAPVIVRSQSRGPSQAPQREFPTGDQTLQVNALVGGPEANVSIRPGANICPACGTRLQIAGDACVAVSEEPAQ